ncbi:3-ketoacyl-ACP synthase [Micromonospora ureilytica]|uniref:3-ketoacyl-ACP synthase n=1 Tax=Micromonospora ureilytica TaxID=709868 RepID=A0A3N9XE19_9ACTN|nr:beta-ketoacyl synthase N-terminal-like domain-containing protein [Micromonospora ureilytica]RQX11404.1 3-ketoacyl-ACP synthase [Micromonospora ureilytica]
MTCSPVLVTGLGLLTAHGRGPARLLAAVLAGEPAFSEVRRFDPGRSRVRAAATLADVGDLTAELVAVVADACDDAGLAHRRAECQLFFATGTGTTVVRSGGQGHGPAELAAAVARRSGLAGVARVYTSACVAGSTALAEAASMIARGRCERAVVAGGFLVDADHQALFDAGRALADDGAVRPFSKYRRGMLLGDGIVAVVLESAAGTRGRGDRVRSRLAGWARAGDAYHVCQPDPGGAGLASAIRAGLARAGVTPAELAYVNANGTGTMRADAAESSALRTGLGTVAGSVAVSSTKSVHGHALEASGLLEFAVTALALDAGQLPVNAGFRAADPQCPVQVVREPSPMVGRYALSCNLAFGGANTALVLGAV